MKCTIPEISWHNRDPVLAVDIQPNPPDGVYRLATGGTDTHVVIWQLKILDNGGVSVEALSDLTRHNRAVNAVRFSPDGEILASSDDESAVILWKKQDVASSDFFADDTEKDNKEHWVIFKMLRGHLEDVYDICWSTCSQFLVTGSVDNSAILWDVNKGKNIGILHDHKGFVQGVAWDPLGQYVVTLCSDRYCRIYNIATKKIACRIYKASFPVVDADDNITEKQTRLFYDDTLKSFCRRLSFSPDGELILAPSGIVEEENGMTTNVTYVFSRHAPSKPVLYLPTKDKYTLAVRFCPILFELKPVPRQEDEQKDDDDDDDDEVVKEEWQKYTNLFHLPYRMVFAVATQNAVLLYDTQQPVPFAKISNIHYTRLSDVAWSSDGRLMVVSSTDGYCSLVSFSEGELGIPYAEKQINVKSKHVKTSTISNSSQSPSQESEKLEVKNNSTNKKSLNGQTSKAEEKPFSIKRPSESSKSGRRVSLVTLSPQVNRRDETPPAAQSSPSSTNDKSLPSQGSMAKEQEESMDIDNEMKKKCDGDTHSPAKNIQDLQSPAKTPSGGSRTPRRVPLITLSSPKGKKNLSSETR